MRHPNEVSRYTRVMHRFDAYPFESLICTLSLLVAGPVIVLGGRPESVDRLLPELLVRVWGFNLLLGAAIVIIGGLILERSLYHKAGLNLLGSACVVYSIAVVVMTGRLGLIGAVILFSIGAACVRRAVTLDRYVTVWATDIVDQLEEVEDKKR